MTATLIMCGQLEDGRGGRKTIHSTKSVEAVWRRERSKYLIFDAPIASLKGSSVSLPLSLSLFL